jgi:hypothetical protein
MAQFHIFRDERYNVWEGSISVFDSAAFASVNTTRICAPDIASFSLAANLTVRHSSVSQREIFDGTTSLRKDNQRLLL